MILTSPTSSLLKRRKTEQGFILIAVLWLSTILSAFAIAVSLSVRSHGLYVRNAMSNSLAQGIADGIVRMMALQIAPNVNGAKSGAKWIPCRWADEAVAWISVQEQSGLVDLNTTSPRLMIALLEGLGLSPNQSSTISAEIRDYRDTDSISDLGEAEINPYPGRLFGPKNSPFETVEELDQIPGMSSGVRSQLKDLTTVYSQQQGFDFNTAPDDLLAVLGLARSSVAGLAFSSPGSSHVTSIVVAVEISDGTRFVRRAIIERTNQLERPFAILSWDTDAWPQKLKKSAVRSSCFSGLTDLFTNSL